MTLCFFRPHNRSSANIWFRNCLQLTDCVCVYYFFIDSVWMHHFLYLLHGSHLEDDVNWSALHVCSTRVSNCVRKLLPNLNRTQYIVVILVSISWRFRQDSMSFHQRWHQCMDSVWFELVVVSIFFSSTHSLRFSCILFNLLFVFYVYSNFFVIYFMLAVYTLT